MRDASILLAEKGVDSIDANMGCPVPKVTKTGGGASMMNELPKTQELIRAMVDAVDAPITAKMRLGWDEENLTAPDLAIALEDAGVTPFSCMDAPGPKASTGSSTWKESGRSRKP